MPAFAKGVRIKHCAVAVLAIAGITLGHPLPSAAQTRTIAGLGDVPTLIPWPYHPQVSAAHYSSALYYGDVYFGVGPHYWH